MRRVLRWLLVQWGYGPVFAVQTVAELFRVKGEMEAASERQARQ